MSTTDASGNKRDAAVGAVADAGEEVAAAHAQWKAAIVRRNSLLRDARETLGVDGKPPTLVSLQLAAGITSPTLAAILRTPEAAAS